MNKFNAIIIDDDPKAIADLMQKLKDIKLVNVIGCANSFHEGTKLIQNKEPDFIFQDVDMPEKNGFEVIKWMKEHLKKIPYVIFVTSHDEYAVRAFKEDVLAYVKKPVEGEDLKHAIDKAIDSIENDTQQQKFDFILNYISRNRQLFLPSPTGFRSVDTNEIIYVWRNGITERLELVFGENDKLILPPNYTLAQLVKILPEPDFFQVKRDMIINIRYVKEVETFNKDCTLQKNGFTVKLQMSRRCMKEFKERIVL